MISQLLGGGEGGVMQAAPPAAPWVTTPPTAPQIKKALGDVQEALELGRMVVQGAADWGGVRVVQLCPEHQLLQSGCCWTWSCSGGCGGPGAFLGVWGGADRPGTARDSPFCGPPGAAVCAQRRTGMGAGPRMRRGPKDGWEAGHWGTARSGDSGSSGNGDRDAAKTRTETRFKRGPGRGRG